MEVQELQLTTPNTHCLFLGPQDESYSGPLSGSVEIVIASSNIDSSGYPKLSVSLTRTVAFERRCAATAPRRSSGLFKCLRRRKVIQAQLSPIRGKSASSSTETITRCDLWHTQHHVEHHQDRGTTSLIYNFGIPVPFDIPPTTETVLGTVSYMITAASTSTIGTIATATRPIQILRLALPGHARTIQHVRTFRGDRVRIFLDITPKESPGPGNKASYTARLCAKQTITEGPRTAQMRHVVIKELKWRVEETAKTLSKPSHHETQDAIYHKEQCVRQLCHGRVTGRWSATAGRPKTEAIDDMIQISFNVNVPRSADAVEVLEMSAIDTKQACLHQRPCECPARTDTDDEEAAIIASHQLKLDIITGEDVIDQETGRLVDRKPLWKSFGAFFPMPVYEFMSSQEIPNAAFPANDVPPMYDDASKPPDYDILR